MQLTDCHFLMLMFLSFLQNAADVIGAISRINFTKLTSFNIVLLTEVDEVKNLKEKMKEEGATVAQSGHFDVQNKPQSQCRGTCTCSALFTAL